MDTIYENDEIIVKVDKWGSFFFETKGNGTTAVVTCNNRSVYFHPGVRENDVVLCGTDSTMVRVSRKGRE